MSSNSKFKTHVFVCEKCTFQDKNGNDCPEKTAKNFRKSIKDKAKELWPKTEVRINGSGCLDHCERGIAAVVYPQGEWLENLRPGDEDKVLEAIKKGS